MNKVKLFTHTDLDGISCAILGILAFGEENIDIEYCNYDDVNQKVEEFYLSSEINSYDKIFITDISVNEEVAEIIERKYCDETIEPSTVLLDHHKSALWLNDYDWANVIIKDNLLGQLKESEVRKMSGTYLFYKWLVDNDIKFKSIEIIGDLLNLTHLVEMVRQYDTWEWHNIYNNEEPKQWNDLFYILGRDKFMNNIIEKIYSRMEFNTTDKLLLELNEEKKQKYIQRRNEEMMIYSMSINGIINNIGVVFAEQYISELGNKLATLHPELDFIAIINKCGTVSLRGIKDDVDLSKIAECYGGGGQPKASGFEINNDVKKRILHEIFINNLKNR